MMVSTDRAMQAKNRWIGLAISSFFIVALIGVILRSKILFEMPFLDYNRLLDAHFHFAFGGWVTLALSTLMVYDILPEEGNARPLYTWLLAGILAGSWVLLLSSPLPANSIYTSVFSSFFVLVTYVFAGVYIRDMLRVQVAAPVRLMAVSALSCLVLSSVGLFVLAYLFASKSLNTFAYRDALYTYLHLMYNGFFAQAVFAILFHRIWGKISLQSQERIQRFSMWLCISILPSLFLTYLWRDPNIGYRVIAIAGSITLLITALSLIRAVASVRHIFMTWHPLVRYMGIFSVSSFLLKTVLQCFTIFPAVGNAVFGDRPVIIGFLHLIFLGFVSLFLVAYFAQTGLLDISKALTRAALVVFTIAILLNEAALMVQGLAGMFIRSSNIFPWLLWAISIILFAGVAMIAAAKVASRRVQ